MIHEVESGADDPIASKHIGFLIRLVLYAICSYAAFFLYTIRKPSIPTSPRAESKESICKNHSKLQSLFHRIINCRQATSDPYENDGDTPRTSASSKDDDGKGKNWHPRRSSPTKKRVRLSCIPFEGPRARIDACMAIDKMSGTLILHGGSSAQNSSLGDTYIFHTNTTRWDRLDINQNHRQNHGLAVTNSGIVVSFGGYDIDTDCSRNGNSLRTIDLEQDEMYWRDQHKFSINKEWPGPRRSHGMCNIEHDKVVMFGGRDCLGTALFDMWILDTAPLRSEGNKDDVSIWTKLKPKGKTRPRVREVVSIAHAGGKIYLFGKTPRSRGEVESFDLSSHKWERQVTCGQEPPEQDCQVHSIENAKRLITISNHEPSACGMFNRMDILDMETTPMTWTTVDNISWCGDWTMIPGPRRSFASALDTTSGFLYVFGGVEGCRSSSTDEPNVLNTLIAVNFSRVISIIKEEESTEDQ